MTSVAAQQVVVVGAASGIGQAIAKDLAGAGAAVFLVDCAEERLLATRRELVEDGRVVAGVAVCDVAEPWAVTEAFARAAHALGGIEVMVNAVGITRFRPFMEITAEDWSALIDVNLTGAFHCSQEAARLMLANGTGCIVNIASQAALHGQRLIAPYAAAKAGLVSLTRTMAIELAPRIRVNAVCPGEVATPMMEQRFAHFAATEGTSPAAQREEMLATIPLGRFQTPESVARVVRFLCSEDAQDVTGQAIVVDGGALA